MKADKWTPLTVQSLRFFAAIVVLIANAFIVAVAVDGGDAGDGSYCQRQNMNKRFLAKAHTTLIFSDISNGFNITNTLLFRMENKTRKRHGTYNIYTHRHTPPLTCLIVNYSIVWPRFCLAWLFKRKIENIVLMLEKCFCFVSPTQICSFSTTFVWLVVVLFFLSLHLGLGLRIKCIGV